MINLATLHVAPNMSFLIGPNKAAPNALLFSKTGMGGVFNASVGHVFTGFSVQPLLTFPPLFRGTGVVFSTLVPPPLFGHQTGFGF